jgi:hypothetical protein
MSFNIISEETLYLSFIIFTFFEFQVIFEINVQIAVFRDLLIHVGTSKDAPELREKIRRVRRQCVEGCKQTNSQILPQIKRFETVLLLLKALYFDYFSCNMQTELKFQLLFLLFWFLTVCFFI